MPELPEIEVLRKEIEPKIIGKKMEFLFSSNMKLRKELPNFTLINQEIIQKVDRLNKYIIIHTDNYYFIIHLGMTGKLIIGADLVKKKHTHMIFKLENLYMTYEDTRRFGLIKIKPKTIKLKDYSIFKNVGLDPIQGEYTFKNFIEIIQSSDKNIKTFLLDQSKICGIGNIYANEIMFLTKLSPSRTTKNLSKIELKSLFNNIKDVLNKAISLGGSSISDYVHSDGSKGQMQNHYYVYGRTNLNCKVCDTKILSMKQNGRSTFYCASCQN